jgi:phage protein D
MPTTATGQSQLQSGVPTDYYAPNYKVEVEGQELHPESKGDILQVKVMMDGENMTSFDMSVNNWDAMRFRFKYSDTRLFDVGNRVHVQMGYADRLVSMMRGQIMTLTPRFPESGQPTLGVSGQDGMVRLRESRPAQGQPVSYVDKADWQIAQAVAERHNMRVNVTKEGERRPLVVQKNQDDAQFLMERAKRIDFDCYVLTDPESGEDTLHFVKPTDGRSSVGIRVYELEWGKNLMSFNPRLTLSRQVGRVTVRGWSPATKSAIVYTTTSRDLPPGERGRGTSGPEAAQRSLGGRQEAVIDAPVASEQEARDLAISLLCERAYEFITGSGQIIGLPDLRPGDNLFLKGMGTRFSGKYYVKRVEHTLGGNGYLTNFEVRQVYDGGLEQR